MLQSVCTVYCYDVAEYCSDGCCGYYRFVSALKALDKLANEEGKPVKKEVCELKADLFAKLGWHHWQRYEQSWIRVKFPGSYPPM